MDLSTRGGKNVEELFEAYLKECRYLRNFSERTITCAQEIFRRWERFVGGMPSKENLPLFVIAMREAGLAVTTCNITIRMFNSFLSWLNEKEITQGLRLKELKEEKKKMRVFSEAEVKKLLAFKPQHANEQRIYAILCTLIDTGLRITECLTIETARIDFDSLLITVKGKGNKQRTVPMSLELRKILHRYYHKHRACKFESPYFFCTANGTLFSRNNARRDLLNVFDKVGLDKNSIDGFFHSWRRYFAKSFTRNGGNLFYLQATLGHTHLEMTRRYVEVEDADLLKGHFVTSPLASLKR
jgi:integrase/recombinase XerD